MIFESWWELTGCRTVGDAVDFARAGWEAAMSRGFNEQVDAMLAEQRRQVAEIERQLPPNFVTSTTVSNFAPNGHEFEEL